MYLINIQTKQLEAFVEDHIPPYAILSHTWGADQEEITFQEVRDGFDTKFGTGRSKFDGCCAQARKDGLSYVWIDTCCIDKSSAVELSEAINSMFRWYKESTVCYVYLSDVSSGGESPQLQVSFRGSRWFTRGWTLQELIAPRTVQFYDAEWNPLGTKQQLSTELVAITGIPRIFLLNNADMQDASVAQRMSWAANRVTKRKEDMAYCLLGIFNISMTMIYGEGDRAFVRLQEEILRHIPDDTILAWGPWKLASSTPFAYRPKWPALPCYQL
ncbi:heterokaryon incompatibility protein-domain-containing protein [Xylariales sp. PMI_506]|nr:heterokaryon incompatibility protein-domain-containing protein [Xylariales sp. PMI_506]